MADMLTVRQIAQRWSIPEYAVYRMVEYGKLTPHKSEPKPWQKRQRMVFDPAEVARVLGEPR